MASDNVMVVFIARHVKGQKWTVYALRGSDDEVMRETVLQGGSVRGQGSLYRA